MKFIYVPYPIVNIDWFSYDDYDNYDSSEYICHPTTQDSVIKKEVKKEEAPIKYKPYNIDEEIVKLQMMIDYLDKKKEK